MKRYDAGIQGEQEAENALTRQGMTLRTHQPFESIEKAIHEDEDIESSSERIYTAPRRILIGDTDEGQRKRTEIDDLEALTEAYGNGLIREKME
jgi:fructose-1,6-bisphosphatase-3